MAVGESSDFFGALDNQCYIISLQVDTHWAVT